MSDSNELDELGEIEKAGLSANELVLSNVYNIKVGGFGEPSTIKTYLCSVKVKDLDGDISFYETLTKDKSWPVSQIIQREVDRIRASNIAKDYILGQGRFVKYFPPLIIAILPKAADDRIDLKLNYLTDNSARIKELIYERSIYRSNDKIKKYFVDGTNTSLVDGLYLLEVSKVFDFNLFCWDRNKHYAIVIDGQHRLASLFKSGKDNPSVMNYTQDIVFLDFSQLIKEEQRSPVEVVRRVFIDINTNAKKVGVVRQILMDDKDLAALFVQSMVDAVRRDGSEKPQDHYLLSQIVDWYGESLKHTLPHITGILSLYQIMEDYLIQGNLSSIDDLRSGKKVEKWVSRMNDIFLVDKKIGTPGSKWAGNKKLSQSLGEYKTRVEEMLLYEEVIEDEFKETEIFSFDYSVLDIAQETFEEKFLRSIIKVFNDLLPYKDTIEIIKKRKGFDKDSLLSMALLASRTRLAKSQNLREILTDIRKHLEDELHDRYYLLFTVLGQKVIINLLFQRILSFYNDTTEESDIVKTSEQFIKDLNRMLEITSIQDKKLFGKKGTVTIERISDELLDLGTVASAFWEGIIYENDRIIYNTQGIRSLTSFIQFLLSSIDAKIEKTNSKITFDISYLEPRVKRIIRKQDIVLTEQEVDEYASQVVKLKENFINKYLDASVTAWKKSK